MKFLTPVLCAVALFSPACTKVESHACTPTGIGWHRPEQGKGFELERNVVSLDREGRIYWNGIAISDQRLGEMLKAAVKLDPRPEAYLEAEMGLPCSDLDRVRNQMETALECREGSGLCVEGFPDDRPKPIG